MARHLTAEERWSELSDGSPSVCLGKLSFPPCIDGEGHFDKTRLNALPLPDQALLLLLMQLSLQGLAGWQAAGAVARICGQFSEDDVLPFVSACLERFQTWTQRPLASDYPFLYVCAHPVRIFGTSEASLLTVLSAVGVSGLTGHRECLGLAIGDGSPNSWVQFFDSLRVRGLSAPDLVISPFLPNMPPAAKQIFPEASFQRCQEELTACVLRRAPGEFRREMRSRLRTLFSLSTLESAEEEVQSFASDFAKAVPNSVSCLVHGFADASTVFQYPRALRPRLGSYHSSFRKLTETLTKREKILTVYPDRDAVCLLVSSVYYSFSQLWFSSLRPFLSLSVYRKWKETGDDSSSGGTRRKSPVYF